MSRVFLFAFTAMLNPTLLAATTLMLLLPQPKKLMLGYLLGALLTSITLARACLTSSATAPVSRPCATPSTRMGCRSSRPLATVTHSTRAGPSGCVVLRLHSPQKRAIHPDRAMRSGAPSTKLLRELQSQETERNGNG